MKLKLFSLCLLVAIIIWLCAETSQADAQIAEIEEIVEDISFEEQIKHDEEVKYEEWLMTQEVEEVVKPHAPYDFLSLDDEYQIYMEERCSELDMNFFFCASLMFSESSFRPGVVSKDGCDYGLFQIRECNWDYYSDEYGLDVFNPLDNIEIGLLMLHDLFEKYEDDGLVIQCFKCGETRGTELYNEGYLLPVCEEICTRAQEWEEKGAEIGNSR